MQFTDAVAVAGTRRRDDGYLIADARVARTGIQVYSGRELGRPDMDEVRVWRPDDEVFSKDTLASFAHRPVTNNHPMEPVNSDNWREHAVGQTSDEIARDGTFIRIPLMVSDGRTITAIEGGKRELSAGYSAELDWADGKTPEGEPYDAVQRNIRANHVAIVDRGRAGAEVRIGDAGKWGAAPISTTDRSTHTMSDAALRTVVVDGLSVSVTDQGAQAIDKLLKDRDTANQALTDAEQKHADAIKAKDEEIGTLKADKKKLEDAQPTPETLQQMVADRAALVKVVETIDSKIEVGSKTDADLRKAAVASKYGDEFVKDASDDQVAGMFKTLAKDVADKVEDKSDPYRSAVSDRETVTDAADPDKAYKGMTDHLTNAWKGETEKGAA